MKLALICVLLLMSYPAHAEKTEQEVRSTIRELMSQRHPVLPEGFWEGLGEGALPVIKKMYFESKNSVEKSFLIDGLSHFKDAATGAFLEGEAAASQNEVLKKKLLSAVIDSEGENAYGFVEPYLKDADAHIRMAVATGLKAYSQNEKIKNRLDEFKAKEKTPWVIAGFERKSDSSELQKTRKPMVQVAPPTESKSLEEVKLPAALTEKAWAGLWRGSLITENKLTLVDLTLTPVDVLAKPIRWKAEFILPKKVKQEWRNGEFTVHYFQTNRAHWIELRHLKLDTVFLAQRKIK